MRIATICSMDAQGRIVIPAAIRKAMHIVDGEALEVESTGEDIRLRRYQTCTADSQKVLTYLDILYSVVPCGAFVCSDDSVCASKGVHLIKGSPIPKELAEYVAAEKETVFDSEHPIYVRPHLKNPVAALFPIIRQSGQLPMALVLLEKRGTPLSEMELGSAKLIAVTLGHQLN